MAASSAYSDFLLQEIINEKISASLMEVCGTHTMAIARSGLRELLPPNIKLLSGPGCPVCVTSQGDIDTVLELVRTKPITLTTFGDMMRVPGTEGSLQEERGRGADVRVVYSPMDALELARSHPDKEVVFLGIGFETTAPTVATVIQQASEERIMNFSVWSLHKLVPPALEAIFSDPDLKVDGLICPGHVSAVIGMKPYELLAQKYGKPCVVTGFDTQDVLEGIYMLLTQLKNHAAYAQNQYRRLVKNQGNTVAMAALEEVFKPADAAWRGLGTIPASGLSIRNRYQEWDARRKFEVPQMEDRPIKGCSCGEVLKGIIAPQECQLFGRACTPLKPVGPCMVSQEGACAAHYRYSPRKGE